MKEFKPFLIFGVDVNNLLKEIRKSKDPFQPIWEAITNAIESKGESSGQISIRFRYRKIDTEKELELIEVEDNGIGFNEENFNRFATLLDTGKGNSNKGAGRIQFLHFFRSAEYESVFKDIDGNYKQRAFKLVSPKRASNGSWSMVEFCEPIDSDTYQCGTVLKLIAKQEPEDLPEYQSLSINDFQKKLIINFLQSYIANQKEFPNIKVQFYVGEQITDEQIIDFSQYTQHHTYRDIDVLPVKKDDNGQPCPVSKEYKQTFRVDCFKLNQGILENSISAFVSKGEIVSSPKLTLSSFPIRPIQKCNYILFVSGQSLNDSTSINRDSVNIISTSEFKERVSDFFDEPVVLLEKIQEKVNESFVQQCPEVGKAIERLKSEVKELIETFGILLPEKIKFEDLKIYESDTIEDRLIKLRKAEQKDKLKESAKTDAKIQEALKSIESLNPNNDAFEAEFKKVVASVSLHIQSHDKDNLSNYVVGRKVTLEVLKKILKRQLSIFSEDSIKNDESYLHNLFFRRHDDHAEDSRLWLLNEEFIHFDGLSEKPLEKIEINGKKLLKEGFSEAEKEYLDSGGRDRLASRPDVLLFPNEGKCIILEFKSTQERVENYISQIARYASLIRQFSTDEFEMNMFYGYLIGGLVIPQDVKNVDSFFIEIPGSKSGMFSSYRPVNGGLSRVNGSLYMEILSYSDIYERALLRNKSFIQRLGIQEKAQL